MKMVSALLVFGCCLSSFSLLPSCCAAASMELNDDLTEWLAPIRSYENTENVEREERSSYINYEHRDIGSGDPPVKPEPQIVWPFAKCVPFYTADRTGVAPIPEECPQLPVPLEHCGCPDPSDVKDAGNDVILDELSIVVVVSSQYVNVSVDGVLFNPHDGVQLADLALRLPEQAFISHFHINVNDEVLVASVEPKDKAKKIFTDAVRRGQTAATVEARGKNEFSTSVAVSRGCRMRFQLRYEYLVERITGQFTVPIQVTPSIPAVTRRLRIIVKDKKPITCIKPDNDVDYFNALFNLTNRFEAEMETELLPNQTRDFILTYTIDADTGTPGTTLVDDKGYFFVSYVLPNSDCSAHGERKNDTCSAVGLTVDDDDDKSLSRTKPFKLCLLFVVDVSGSMNGNKIDQAKRSLLYIIGRLSSDDCIGIILFSSRVERKTTGFINVGENRALLWSIVINIRASGSTNFDGALQDAMDKIIEFSSIDCVYIMVALTDGHPTAGVTDAVKIASRFKRKVKSFTGKTFYPYFLGFGTNYELDFGLLQTLAAKNHGYARRIYRGSDVKTQLVEFFKEIACPVLCAMKVDYHTPVENTTELNLNGCYFDGSQLLVAGRVTSNRTRAILLVKGMSSEGEQKLKSQNFRVLLDSTEISLVQRTWAYLQIKQLIKLLDTLTGDDRQAMEAEVLRLSLQYQFVTTMTSLVVVKPCKSKSVGRLESIDEKGHVSSTPSPRPVVSLPTTAPRILPALPASSRFSSFFLPTRKPFSLPTRKPFSLPTRKPFFILTLSPVIIRQPAASANFTVGAKRVVVAKCRAKSQGPIHYIWEKYDPINGLWVLRPRDNSRILTIDRISQQDAGTYRCVAINNYGITGSNNITVTVHAKKCASLLPSQANGAVLHVSNNKLIFFLCQSGKNVLIFCRNGQWIPPISTACP